MQNDRRLRLSWRRLYIWSPRRRSQDWIKNVSLRSYVSTIYRSAPRKKSYRQPCYAVGIGVKTNRARTSRASSGSHTTPNTAPEDCERATTSLPGAPRYKTPDLCTSVNDGSAPHVMASRSMASQPARATIASALIHNEPFPVTANMVADPIMAADTARHAR